MFGKLIKPKAVADLTGFHPRTVSDMGKRGDIPGAVLIGRHVRFDANSVLDFIGRGGLLKKAAEPKSANEVPATLL
jgi:predicted DNA-binding transcriptional regulator AlpA